MIGFFPDLPDICPAEPRRICTIVRQNRIKLKWLSEIFAGNFPTFHDRLNHLKMTKVLPDDCPGASCDALVSRFNLPSRHNVATGVIFTQYFFLLHNVSPLRYVIPPVRPSTNITRT
jgi:hypothetical protein